jgi:hypothetical protein
MQTPHSILSKIIFGKTQPNQLLKLAERAPAFIQSISAGRWVFSASISMNINNDIGTRAIALELESIRFRSLAPVR